MTNEEAIEELKAIKSAYSDKHFHEARLMRSEHEALDMAIKALVQEPCDDAISRQVVLEKQYRIDDSATLSTRDVVNVEDIEDLPSVNPQEPKTGHWIENAPEYQNIDPPYICSECGNMHLRKTNYCDQCGCRMVEPQESEGIRNADSN